MTIRHLFLVLLFTAVVLTVSGNALAGKYLLGKEIALSSGGAAGTANCRWPAVAYNWQQKEYLEVDHYNILSSGITRIRASRVWLKGSRIFLGDVSYGNACKYSDVAYDPQNRRYLIVWSQYNSVASRWEIYGRIIPWDSLGTNAPFLIASWSNLNLQIPAVAFGYNTLTGSYRYMVVWQTSDVTTGALKGIGRRPVSTDGSPLGTAAYMSPGPNDGFPDITFNVATTQYLVVWAKSGGATGVDISGLRLDLDGVTQGSTISISSDLHDQQNPSVTTNTQHRYLVAWQHDYGGKGTDWDIRGQFLNVTGGKEGTRHSIAETTESETHPALAASGGIEEYLAVWQRETPFGKGIWGRLLYTDLPMLSPFEIAPPGGGDNEDPAAGCHNTGYFVSYSWDSFSPESYSDIYGRMLLKPILNPGLWLLLLDN